MNEQLSASSYSFRNIVSDAMAARGNVHVRFPSSAELFILGGKNTYLQHGCSLTEIAGTTVEDLSLTTVPEEPELLASFNTKGRELSELMWMLAYYQAEDFHRDQSKKTDVYKLVTWPNFTRLPHKSSFVDIASLLMHRAHSCKIVSGMLRVPLEDVLQFCSCGRAAGYLETVTSASKDEPLKVLPERKSSLVSSILNRLQR